MGEIHLNLTLWKPSNNRVSFNRQQKVVRCAVRCLRRTIRLHRCLYTAGLVINRLSSGISSCGRSSWYFGALHGDRFGKGDDTVSRLQRMPSQPSVDLSKGWWQIQAGRKQPELIRSSSPGPARQPGHRA